ncbi:LPS export ABC transporter periplasmic protein LptC [Fulvivirga sedimenti]|uniref:LPS export ABC transporter periplasmic protein LptC n=1 Tax=Fulvivirga sedimenti TaxID=2879465 RepID=A0A9X1KYR7_9BACT|nr:LPS export ABC transporter periplasmic protein LptC [Fulvivirga sedimenti]MCA6078183.1 LPS export ABC transporter periplasmic protein LptC [Fulvivirga sedimenti]
MLLVSIACLTGCEEEKKAPSEILEYEGPFQEAEDLVMLYSESAKVQIRLTTPKLWEYENGDREFPEGIFLEFFNDEGEIGSTLRADEAFFFKEENKWRGRGDVEIRSMENNQQLDTEELYWKPAEQIMYTDKFVTIIDGDEIMTGTGMRAAQDFSWYGFGNPEGTFNISE